MRPQRLALRPFWVVFWLGFTVMIHGASLDYSFNPGTGANAFVESTLVQPDGRILICGAFTEVDGVPRNYIARLHADGSVDTTFQANPSYWVRHMALQEDGKILIGGFFAAVDGISRKRVARLNANGTLDTTFNPGLGCDGKIVPVDPTEPFVFAVAIQADGKIIIGGNFTHYDGAARCGVARLNSNGSLDASFDVGAGVNSWVRSILVLPNEQIFLSGWFTSYDNRSFNRMVRLNMDGTADATFAPFFGDKTAVYTMAQQANGKIVVGGHSVSNNTPFRQEIRRLNSDGSYDSTFNPGGQGADEKVECVTLQPDGKIIMAGYFGRYNGVLRKNLARLNPDGTLDTSFKVQTDNWIWTAAWQPDGKLVICGGFSLVDGVSRNGVARLNVMESDEALPSPKGALAVWFLNGTNYLGSAEVRDGIGVSTGWKFVGAADFNADNKTDFIWQHVHGSLAAWFMSGTRFLNAQILSSGTPGWSVTAVGDLDGDAQSDLLWRHKDGRLAAWLMNQTNRIRSVFLRGGQRLDQRWQVAGIGDFDGDAKPDLVWRHTDRRTAVWLMDGTKFLRSFWLRQGQPSPPGWHLCAVGDLNNDSQNDLLWQHSGGQVAAWFMNRIQFNEVKILFEPEADQRGWRVMGLKDLDGNGQNEAIWRYLP